MGKKIRLKPKVDIFAGVPKEEPPDASLSSGGVSVNWGWNLSQRQNKAADEAHDKMAEELRQLREDNEREMLRGIKHG